jgi:hypothetical protein
MTRNAADASLFRRIIVGFPGPAGSSSDLEAVARFARHFNSQLIGRFLEDTGVLAWASLGGSRHFSRGSTGSENASQEDLSRAFSEAAAVARARLARAAASLGLAAQFEVRRDLSPSTYLENQDEQDLNALIEPFDPFERMSYPFAGALAAVAKSSSPVLYVPRGTLNRAGPVLALVEQEDRANLDLAARVAAALGAKMQHLTTAVPAPALPENFKERLIVLSRGLLSAHGARSLAGLLAQRRVPGLIVGPPAYPDAGANPGKADAGGC